MVPDSLSCDTPCSSPPPRSPASTGSTAPFMVIDGHLVERDAGRTGSSCPPPSQSPHRPCPRRPSRGVVAVVATVGSQVKRHRHALPAGSQRAAQEGLETGQRVGVRQVFGVCRCVEGLTVMPSGSDPVQAFTSPPGADGRCLGPGLQRGGGELGALFWGCHHGEGFSEDGVGVVARDARQLPMWRSVYIIHNYSFKIFRAAYNPAHVSHTLTPKAPTKKLPSNCASASSAASWSPAAGLTNSRLRKNSASAARRCARR